MTYIRIVESVPQPYSFAELRRDNPNTSFPREPSASLLAEYDVFPLVDGTRPEADVVEAGPITEINGVWTQTYTGRAYTPQEAADALDAKRARLAAPRLACRLVMLEQGMWSGIQPALDAMPSTTPEETLAKERALAFFEDARVWRRTDATVVALGGMLSLTDEQLDQMFEQAMQVDQSLEA